MLYEVITCSHRGTKICERSSGHVGRQFVCPYHAWSYGLDGRLSKIPNVRDEASIDREKYGLKPVAIDSWDGMIFVNLAEDPRPLRDQLAIEPGEPLSWGRYRVGELRVARITSYNVCYTKLLRALLSQSGPTGRLRLTRT